MVIKKISIIVTAIVLFASCCEAKNSPELSKKLDDFFHSFDGSANITKGDIYNGQKAGYGTGGGVVIRNRVMNVKPATINLPRMDAGCGGIDIYAGGFSYINSNELISTLKSIGTSAAGYAFLLGLETVSPQVTNTIKQLQSWSNTVNSTGINSCETAAAMVGSVWPKKTMAKEHICQMMSSYNGIGSDFISNRHDCANSVESKKNVNMLLDSNPMILVGDYNLTWKAIQNQNYLKHDQDLAELMMTITGTVIVRTDELGDEENEVYPSKISDEAFLKFLLEGGRTHIYRCKDRLAKSNKCLMLDVEEIVLDKQDSWLGKVQRELEEIQIHILHDEELTESQKDFLTRTRLPLYKVVNVLTAYRQGYCPVDLYHIADLVATDLLIQYLKENVTAIREGCQQLHKGAIYDFEIQSFLNELKRAEDIVRHYELKERILEREYQLVQKIEILEEKISSQINLF